MRNMLKHAAVWAAALLLLIAVPAAAQNNAQPPQPHGNVADLKVTDKDYTLGPKDAKIVLVEYASLTCSQRQPMTMLWTKHNTEASP